MAFRDDRDAQLARAAALERENRRLEEELARHKAEAAAADEAIAAAEARGRAAAAGKREEALADENAELREELARARGPGLLRRAGARIARLRPAEPSGDGGYWHAALETWRILVPVATGLLVSAPFLGARAVVVSLLAPVAAVACAAILLAIPWLLRRRRRTTAGGIAGTAIGAALSLALVDRMMHGGLPDGMYLAMATALVAMAGMLLTGAVRWSAMLGLAVVFSPLLALPTPAHLMVWMALGSVGASLVDPRAKRD